MAKYEVVINNNDVGELELKIEPKKVQLLDDPVAEKEVLAGLIYKGFISSEVALSMRVSISSDHISVSGFNVDSTALNVNLYKAGGKRLKKSPYTADWTTTFRTAALESRPIQTGRRAVPIEPQAAEENDELPREVRSAIENIESEIDEDTRRIRETLRAFAEEDRFEV